MLLTRAKYTTGSYFPVRFYTTEKYLPVWGGIMIIFKGGEEQLPVFFEEAKLD
jgi:hypothetical protein